MQHVAICRAEMNARKSLPDSLTAFFALSSEFWRNRRKVKSKRYFSAGLNFELWGASTHRVFQRVFNNLSPTPTLHQFRASAELQLRIPCSNCLRNGRWSALTLVVTI